MPGFVQHPLLGEFKLLKCLGVGGFSQVYLAESVQHKFNVAIKILSRDESYVDETELLENIDSPFVVKIFDVFKHEGRKCIMMEYVEGQTLYDLVNKKHGMSEDDARPIFLQMCLAVLALHKKNIVHRDIKCENAIIDVDGALRLIDFGFARNTQPLMTTYCGSPSYVAPELVLRRLYTSEIDVWAMGVVLYTILTGNHPFISDNIQELFTKILKEEPLYPDSMSNDAKDLLKGLLNKFPSKRLTIDKIISHPWFNHTVLTHVAKTNLTSTICIRRNSDDHIKYVIDGQSQPDRLLLAKIQHSMLRFSRAGSIHNLQAKQIEITAPVIRYNTLNATSKKMHKKMFKSNVRPLKVIQPFSNDNKRVVPVRMNIAAIQSQ